MDIDPANPLTNEPGYEEYRKGEISFEEFSNLIQENASSSKLSPEEEAYYSNLSDFYASSEGQEIIFRAIKRSANQNKSLDDE